MIRFLEKKYLSWSVSGRVRCSTRWEVSIRERVVVFGAGGFGREVLQLLRDIERAGGRQVFAGFMVDAEIECPAFVNGGPVFRGVRELPKDGWDSFVVAVGSPVARKEIVERLKSLLENVRFGTLIHPRAGVGDTVQLGEGCVIAAGSILTANIILGSHVHVNINATVGHDSVIDDYVTIDPGVNISGSCHLEDGADIGSGANLIPKVRIGAWSVIGAGAVVVRDIPQHCTAVGIPAKPIKLRQGVGE